MWLAESTATGYAGSVPSSGTVGGYFTGPYLGPISFSDALEKTLARVLDEINQDI
jgi:hypothetical protein